MFKLFNTSVRIVWIHCYTSQSHTYTHNPWKWQHFHLSLLLHLYLCCSLYFMYPLFPQSVFPAPPPFSSPSLPRSPCPSSHSSPAPSISLCQLIKLDLSHSAKWKLNPGPWTPSFASAPHFLVLYSPPALHLTHVTKGNGGKCSFLLVLLLHLFLNGNHNVSLLSDGCCSFKLKCSSGVVLCLSPKQKQS